MPSMRSSEELVNQRGLSLTPSQPAEPPACSVSAGQSRELHQTPGRVATGTDIALVPSGLAQSIPITPEGPKFMRRAVGKIRPARSTESVSAPELESREVLEAKRVLDGGECGVAKFCASHK